jgi:hypothetical protein
MSSGRQSGNSPANQGHAPNNACRDFWRTGQCRFGARCKYSHQRAGHPAPPARPAAGPPASATVNRRAHNPVGIGSQGPGATNGNLGPVVDAGQAANYLERFCSPTGNIKTLGQIKILIKVLNGVASETSNWVCFGHSLQAWRFAEIPPFSRRRTDNWF